ncbi:hypothetical protein LTS16_026558 [Friedmanniomyces endolithicus]|nr:hypothetical protein LTS16_026558 [Friedmanniomyces endolithicus]
MRDQVASSNPRTAVRRSYGHLVRYAVLEVQLYPCHFSYYLLTGILLCIRRAIPFLNGLYGESTTSSWLGAWGGKKNDEEDGANRTPPFSRPSSDTILLVDNELPKRATSDIPEESETRTRQRKRKRKRKQDREPSKESKQESEELDVHAGTHKEELEQGQQPAHGHPAPTLDDSTSLATTDVSPLTTFTPCEPTDVISIDIFEEGLGECLAEAFATSRRWEEARIFKYGNEVATTWKRWSTPEEARTAWTRKMDEQQRAWDILSESDDSRD